MNYGFYRKRKQMMRGEVSLAQKRKSLIISTGQSVPNLLTTTTMASNESETANNSLSSDLAGTDASNLFRVIDRDNVHGLNLTVPEDAKEVIKPWDEREETTKFIESNVDDQLIIHIPFTQNVRIKSVLIKLGRGEVTPRHLRIYTNHNHIVDFADTENTKPQLNISLLEGETRVVEYPLRVASFVSVHSLSLFFSDSIGGDVSRLYYLGFKGDMRSVKREANSRLEVPAPNAADAPLTERASHKASGMQTTAR
ncbi:PITH domain-containing protein [Psilocybe cubensis]|uniref:PITH domain-containing protein n=2 Tax=Psilocybe cubensis TaxID=181762 RepID=A0ACB8GSW7_PSICU|nr:PITH domain-containing protein [Psilocybe cubensis]KAH9478733.1 PITH domain-containing protein [Psilocybe cubensis]